MPLKNFKVELEDSVYETATKRAQDSGQTLEQILTGLLSTYAKGESGVTTYTVKRGDTLAKIAGEVYGDPQKYPVIQHANKIEEPSRIWVGQVLAIPALAGGTPPPPEPVAPAPAPAPQPLAPAPAPSPAPTPAARA